MFTNFGIKGGVLECFLWMLMLLVPAALLGGWAGIALDVVFFTIRAIISYVVFDGTRTREKQNFITPLLDAAHRIDILHFI